MKSTNKNWILLGILFAPLLVVQSLYQLTWKSTLIHWVVSASLVLLLNASQRKLGWKKLVLKSTLVLFYFIFLFLLLFEVTLFDFTGRGFTNEVYFHFELESIKVAFNEYSLQILIFTILIVFYTFFINTLLKKSSQNNHYVTLIIALGVLITVTTNSSMARFSSGFLNYLVDEPEPLDQTLINKYIDLGVLKNGTITTQKNLDADLQADSKNLILLYLESFNEGLLELEQYPDLTPNLNRLTKSYNQLKHLSSAYVTIEGVISSQCGTMLPMTAGNNTFLNNGQLMSNLPCLGDVLQKAGYTQYYLGGAVMEFAGKGRFFENHGYDHIWGLEHWHENGFITPAGEWGLSDNQLFENALKTIKAAAKNPPYNVTLLTLGTHAPGFIYDGCSPYPNSDELFINAIHCTDQLVGTFVNELEQSGVLDDAVLMIVADHGVFPTAKMKTLFGKTADDRHLFGITNYTLDSSNIALSSYDLAPTLLDMLNINHNAVFLFGQSLFKKNSQHQKYVTRYGDWDNSGMILNQTGQCAAENTLEWPLNSCQKQQLLSLTSQLLEYYSFKEPTESLSCDLDVEFVKNTDENGLVNWSLLLNQINHFDHFYSGGFLLKSSRISSGSFVFVLNDDLEIKSHLFFIPGKQSEKNLPAYIANIEQPILIVRTQINHQNDSLENFSDTIKIELYRDKKQLWSKESKTYGFNNVKICH